MVLYMCAFHLAAALTMSLFVWMARLSDSKKALNTRVDQISMPKNSLRIIVNTSTFRYPVSVTK